MPPARSRHFKLSGARALAAAVPATVLCWVILVPWDLSSADSIGRAHHYESSWGDPAVRVFIAVGAIYLLALAAAIPGWVAPVPATIAASITWITLVTWRGFSAQVSGANMSALWPIIGIPVSAFGCTTVVLIDYVVHAIRERHSDPGISG
jgi:hypothetical protein